MVQSHLLSIRLRNRIPAEVTKLALVPDQLVGAPPSRSLWWWFIGRGSGRHLVAQQGPSCAGHPHRNAACDLFIDC